MSVAFVCKICSATSEEKVVRKCPICFQYVCEQCGYFFGGRLFCNKGCADYFFFGAGDEEDN
ncbi:MAG: hypothetical protein C5B54_04345 [Acidobacteria bacterium]|nr:MAG: hypothetical protein C5B54_04345 [Acidobacteriota bacterium]